MDTSTVTTTGANHTAYNQNQGMFKAYGLVYRLLQNGIPVSWAISNAKTLITDTDVTVSDVTDLRTTTDLGSWDYAGGPFIIDSADRAAAEPIIRAWWAANANQPNVHVAQAQFDADVNVRLTKAPLIAEDSVNANIAIGYFNAAGIPDLNGRPWSTTSPNILTEQQIASGALYEPAASDGCAQRKFDTYVTPHNTGFSYSLTDPTNLGTRTYAQLDSFVHDGGGWTALCHSILSNENAIADLTTHGSPAVTSLFDTSRPGGQPGGFLTKSGFPTISNAGATGTWTVNPGSAGLPIAQVTPTTGAQALPGGSVQTWPSPDQANPPATAPAYWAHTEDVASFTASGIKYDHVISGTYHDGTGAGKLTFIGGHQFSTSLPYLNNTQAPYVRMFYNSLFFNGAAVAKLDLTTSPDTFPQNGSGTVNLSITNTGGSVATSARNLGITLQPGFTYVETVNGPQPDVVDGQHLVWNDLGDIAGGASPVTIKVSVDPSVSATVGTTQIASFAAQYGDVFNEGFTAGVCHDITIVPEPAPTLTKTPDTQGPISTGAAATWTLNYGNPGAAALQTGVLQDTLPPGFSYVSSTSSPDLGSPTVIPAATGTIVRWSVGTIAASTAAAGTVTITARAGAVTTATGDPPQQTFTNQATLTGADAAGTPFSATASADVVVQPLGISLGKSVDKTQITSLPDSLTYTLTPESSGNDQLQNVRVIDPYPAQLEAPPTAISAGGTYGAYTPVAAAPGHDAGPPVLDTSLSVSQNVVDQGGTVTVTMTLTSNTAVNGVTPSDLTFSGGNATCTDPTPTGPVNVPANTNVTFAWTCTLDDTGEYLFTASGGNADDSVDWPGATSASVLSIAGGSTNVITWNLGSTTPPVAGENLTGGTTSGVFAFTGDGHNQFDRYDTTTQAWAAKANAPANVKAGGALTTNGTTTVWGMQGDGKQGFWAYNVANNTWTAEANVGANVQAGGALQYLNFGGTGYVYALMGNGTQAFRRYNVTANTWAAEANTGYNVKDGGALTTDGTYIYALMGNGGGQSVNAFMLYDPSSNTWTRLANTPASPVKWGGALTYANGYVYAFQGGGTHAFWRYNVGNPTCLSAATATTALCWSVLANAPAGIQNGGALTTDGTNIFAFMGNTKQFWTYNVGSNSWSRLADYPPANVKQGGSLVYVPGYDPQGYFTSLEASRSLVSDGDTITVTFTARSSNNVTGVNPGSLNVSSTGGASCSSLTGPTLTSDSADITDLTTPVTFAWQCTVAAGTNPGSLTFSDAAGATGSNGAVTFPQATSNSTLVIPALTFTGNVPTGTPDGQIVNQAMLVASGQTANSPPVFTFVGSPKLDITKSNSPGSDTPIQPGDPIHYTMTVENTGVATATNAVVTDPVPDNAVYTSCSGGMSCSESGGIVSWQLGSLAPGDTATVSFVVAARTDLEISQTPYEIHNAATVQSDQTGPVQSNATTNQVQVMPSIVKSVTGADGGSGTAAAPGDTLTYGMTVSNPGAPFVGDVTDPLPDGVAFAGNCDPDSCTSANGEVIWSGVTFPTGTSTFSFAVTVTAGGGSTIINTAAVVPTEPEILPGIESNPVQTDVGPELAIAKFNDPTGQVSQGDQITYTLLITNESGVVAHDVTATDPVPSGTTFDGCTTPDGTTCAQASGVVTWQLGDVTGGSSIPVTFTVTVGPPGVGQLYIGNQAQVTSSNNPATVSSNQVFNPLGDFPDLALQKSADQTSVDTVGQVIHYSYVVSNNSATTSLAGPVTVDDDKVGTVTCPPGDLAPLSSVTCTGTYTVTQADLDNGSVVNTATAHAGGIDSNQAQTTVPAEPHPALSLEKSIAAGGTFSGVGDIIAYQYVVTNTGNITLANVGVRDDNADSPPTCPAEPLPPGASATCTAQHTVTQADLDAGQVVNDATAFSGEVESNTASATAHANVTAGVELTKSSDATSETGAGDTITYSFLVKNTGSVTITAFAVTDPLDGLSEINCHGVTELAPEAETTCTATYTVIQADVDAGKITNTAFVAGTTANAGDVSAEDTHTTILSQDPAVTITKSSNATTDTGAGDTITYSYLVRNTGDVTLTSFTVTDAMSGLSPIDCGGITSLAPGASATCTATYTVTQDDVDAGSLLNTAQVTATAPSGQELTATDTLHTPITSRPELTLAKSGVLDISASDPIDRANPGDTIAYTLTATNTGNTTLRGVHIADSQLGTLSCTPDEPATLAPQAQLECTGTYTLTQTDIDAGTVHNEATAQNEDGSTTAQASDDVTVPQVPALTLLKQSTLDTTVVDPPDRADAGDKVHYTLTASNAGNTTLHNVTISDPLLTDLSCPQAATLAPGQQLVCTGTHTLTQADIDAGKVVNTASAASDEAKAEDQENEVGLSPAPGLTLTKTGTLSIAAADGVARPGDTVGYELTATNTGNTTLTGVAISDPKLGPLVCDQPVTVVPGGQLHCTGSYTLTQADIDAGRVTNTATAANGDGTTTAQDQSQVDVPQTQGLTLTKDGDLVTNVVEPDGRADAGDRIDYTLVATNTGNTTLHDVSISDPSLPNLSCDPDEPATLAPGATLRCTGSHTLTQADIDAGRVDNSATAHSTEVPSSPPATETVTIDREPGLSLVKDGELVQNVVAPDDQPNAGDRVDYTLVATNTGNTTLHGVSISDPSLPNLSCTQPVDLAPGETLTCTANHTLTQADIDAGTVHNTATAANSDGSTTAQDSETVDLPQRPGLELQKTGKLNIAAQDGLARPGDTITYTLTATNTGNTTLSGVQISDPKLGTLDCLQPATLTPGDSLVCTGSLTLTQADIDAGTVANAATANSTQNTPADAAETVTVPSQPQIALAKHAEVDMAVVAPDTRADAGDVVNYALTASNTGTVTLHNVVITDPTVGQLTCDPHQPAVLAPGDDLECTGQHTLTQADIDAGTIHNTASVTSTEIPTPQTTDNTVPLTNVRSLSLVKTGTLDETVVAPTDQPNPGDTIDYTLTATNSGNTTLHNVTVSDPLLPDLTCAPQVPADGLAPGGQIVCTGTHVLTQEDIDATEVANTATATADDTPPATDSETVKLPGAPGLDLTKSGIIDQSVVQPTDRVDPGDQVHYTLTATNTGNTTLHDVLITDDTLGELNCTQPATLAPGQDLVCTATHTLTQADIDAGRVDNVATVTSDATAPRDTPATITLPPQPSLTLAKDGDLVTDVVPPDGRADAGDRVDYTLTATNTGNVTLHNVSITDANLGQLDCTQPVDLAPGATLECKGSYTLTLADIDAGIVHNSATVTSTETGEQPPVSAPVTIPRAPAVSLAKTGSVDMTVVDPGDRADAGDHVNYTLTATNTGNTTLHDVSISDTKLGALTCDQPVDMAPGATLVCTGSYTLTQDDIDAGTVQNSATVTSTETGEQPPVSVPVTIPSAHGLTLDKTGAVDMSVVDPHDRADAGDHVNYTLTATNTGNTTLHNVSITDTKLGALTCDQPVDLAPGATLQCTGSYTLTQDDVNAGTVQNSATVTSTETGEQPPVSVPVTIPSAHGLTLEKTGTIDMTVVAPNDRADAGDHVNYTLTATNTGNTTQHNVSITDTKLGTLTCDQPVDLAPGATLQCTGSYTLTQDDIDAGTVHNSATVTSTEIPEQPPVPEDVEIPQVKSLSLDKLGTLDMTVVAPDDEPDEGDAINYTLTATNTGNTTLTGVQISDSQLGTLSCTVHTQQQVEDVQPPVTLAPGDKLVCSGTHTLSQPEIDAGGVTNTATADSDQNTPSTAENTVGVPEVPELTLAKTGTVDATVVDPADRVDAGDRVDYTLTATNTGNTTLRNVTITDPQLGQLDCAQPATLGPGQTLECRASHTLTQAEIDAGGVQNTATADSDKTEPTNTTATVKLPPEPGLSLTKDGELDMTVVAPNDRADAGDKVLYTLRATNSGNTTLHHVSISDPALPDLSCTPPQSVAALAPGATLECTATHVLTQADIDRGTLVNTAGATSDEALAPPATEEVTIPRVHTLQLEKTGSLDMSVVPPAERADVGDVVNYTLTATNEGNTTLTGVHVTDTQLESLSCTPSLPAALPPGVSLICTGTHVLTQDDLDAGAVENTATATSDQTEPTTDHETTELPEPPPAGLSLVKSVAETSFDHVGQILHYTYLVTNTGGVSLAAPVEIDDDLADDATCPLPTSADRLGVGDTLICTGTHTVTQADLDAGAVTNEARATAEAGSVTSEPSSATVHAVQVSSLSLSKSATPAVYTAHDNLISYRYVVTNTGNVTIPGPVTVSDTLTHVGCPSGGLAPRQSMTCTATYTITPADLEAGSVTNVATAHANGIRSNPASATVTNGTQPPPPPPAARPGISIAKMPASQQVTAGGRATFTITVTNTGTATLRGVTVNDPAAPACSRSGGNLPALAALAPGASVSYTCSLQNVRSGFTNVATATGAGPDGQQVTSRGSARVTVVRAPAPTERPSVTLVSGPSTQQVAHGGRARFVITVRNTGNVILRNVRITAPNAPNCARVFALLRPSESRTYTCTRSGVHTNFQKVAYVTGRSPAGTSVRARTTVAVLVRGRPARQKPLIMILKDPDHQRVQRGQVATFHITVKNLGNVPLHDVKVSDPHTPGCRRTIKSLAVGVETVYRCHSAGVLVPFTNTATATGVAPDGVRVSASDIATVTGPSAPTAPPPLLVPGAPPFTG